MNLKQDILVNAFVNEKDRNNTDMENTYRSQSMKREKSHTDSIEREKKRVKFNTNYIECSITKSVKIGKENHKSVKPGRNIERGILKNKYIHIDENYDKNWSSIPPQEDECKENHVINNTINESLSNQSSETAEESSTVQRQNTFTKDDLPEDNEKFLIDIQRNKRNNDSEMKTTKLLNQKQNKHQDSSNNKGTTVISQSKTRKRIIPTTSDSTPEIINVKDRNSSMTLKRNNKKIQDIKSDKEDLGERNKIPEERIRKKRLKTDDEECTKKIVKESYADSKRESATKQVKTQSSSSQRENGRMQEEIQMLKEQIKISEEKLKEQSLRERDLINQQRALKEQNEIETSKFIRSNKREAAVLLAELKSKERFVSKLEKALQSQAEDKNKAQSKNEAQKHSNNHSIPRPSLTRSVSAAAALGRRVKLPTIKLNKTLKKDEIAKSSVARQREELNLTRSGAQKRYVSKLEQMRKQIEDQQREIASLSERLKGHIPNLRITSQLSASVPTINELEKEDKSSRSTSTYPGGVEASKNESSAQYRQNLPQGPPYEEKQMNHMKECEAGSNCAMTNTDELRCKSLDLFGPKYVSLESSSSFLYSSLVSLNGNRRESDLVEENELLRAELQETRDHAELLEFRILEFTEGIQRATSVVNTTCDQSTNTTADDVTTTPPISEDLSLPLSVDSGLELNIDVNKSRLSEYRKSLSRLEEASGYNEASSVSHLASLLDWISSLSSGQYEVSMSPRSPIQKKMGVPSALEEHRLEDTIEENDLTMLAARLQESLANPKMQESVLEETIAKLRLVNSSLARLHSRVNSLTHENKELQEALNVLNESHETRTEASGTESELVNGKSPSLHSDLSDSESDDISRPAKSNNLETSTSFQESGIFESSCEMINAATQTLQENDECLVAALEGEKVTLCKIEYDSIVATERSLQREIEMLQYEKEQLNLQCSSLEEKLQKYSNKDDISEVLRAEARLLEARLETAERHKRLYFDEKCELEEAENDARLLSQRLESQLEAAREMESLLSASLSQEQEFCRELQRRVREMHVIDKGRRMHEEVLEKESQFCRRREAALMVANDSQKSQLTFTLYGLILAQFWRRFAARNNKAVVPFSSLIDNSLVLDLSQFSAETSFVPTFPCVSECEKCMESDYKDSRHVPVNDAFTQTPKTDPSDVGSCVDQTMAPSDLMRSLSKHLANNNGLSEREEYYLSQIEELQKERNSLREDYENEQSLLIGQLQNMKSDLERLQQNLEESQREKCKLVFKVEEAQTVINGFEMQLENQIKDLKREFGKSVEVYQQEQKAMQDQYEERIVELRRNVEIHEQRFSALLQQYSILQHELEPYFHNVSDGDEYSSDGVGNGKIITTKDLLTAVRELVRSQSAVKQKLGELEKKESAYRETINEADRIMSNHVTMYTGRIEELEGSVEQKSLRIKQLEASEERMRNTMKRDWKSGEGTRITELLDRLIETENSELNLKERVWNLERNGKELQIKFAEAEKAQENLRSELRDQEELVQRLMTLSTENNALTTQLQEAHEAARRASDIQQSENYLKNRVDELELTENTLRDSLKQAEHLMKQRERKYRDQISNLEEEISLLRSQLEGRMNDAEKAKEVESLLRQHIEDFKAQIHNLEKDLKDSSSESICHETQHRSEVTKLRSQLNLANSQLTDFDTLNGELKERLEAAQSAMKEVAVQLDERSKRHENEVLSLNLQLTQKDSKIEEYEVQFQQYSHSNVARELDFLSTLPLVNLQHTLDSFIRNVQNCDTCRENQSACYDTLSDCLKTLNEVLNGRSSQSDSESEDSESARAENLANEPSTTSPPNPTQEGFDTSSGEGDTSSVYSLTLTNDSGTERGEKLPMKVLPLVPPRPRRDAKKKKKLRKSIKNEGSLLDELEESATVENGSFYGQFPPSIAALEELEEKVRELEEVIARKDEELRLADGEANDLQSRLMEEDEKLVEQTEEACKSNDALVTLRQQLVLTVEEYENAREQLEAKHKVDLNKLSKKIEATTEDLLRLTKKAHLKDKIINTLIKQIRSILRSSSTAVLVTQIRQISREAQRKGKKNESLETDLEIIDFDVDSVCELLEQNLEDYEGNCY